MAREGQHCTNQLLRPKQVGLPRLWALEPELFQLDETSQTDIDVERMKRQWGFWMNDAKRPVLIEKTPVNAARVRWLQAHFENAVFIGIVRNGYAVAEGIRRKAGHSLEESALQWQRSNQIMMSDFAALHSKTIVRYEDLTEHPTAVLEETLSFLGLSYAQLDDIEGQIWQVHGEVSKLTNMNDRSLQALTEQEKNTIHDVAGEMLLQLGYESSLKQA
jgi:hypothetical protein